MVGCVPLTSARNAVCLLGRGTAGVCLRRPAATSIGPPRHHLQCLQGLSSLSSDGPGGSARPARDGGSAGGPVRAAPVDEGSVEFERWTTARHRHITDGFLGNLSEQLRGSFEKRMGDPRHTRGDRFVWDYWHVEDQYTLLRTPAQNFFPEVQYRELEDALLEYAQEELGCRSLSPIWLSCYIDGCHQGLHADNPHGPWAFVLSLTPPGPKAFSGGETMILQKRVLDYWRTFDSSRGTELPSLVEFIPSEFDRLTVFDPRFPHGVREVHGTRDPLKARLVLHGWFSDPSPFFTGGLSEAQATPVINEVLGELFQELAEECGQATGTLAVRLRISGKTGSVTDVTSLTDTLIPVPGQGYRVSEDVRDEIQDCVRQILMTAQFPKCAAGDSTITIPLVFE